MEISWKKSEIPSDIIAFTNSLTDDSNYSLDSAMIKEFTFETWMPKLQGMFPGY